MMGFSSSLQGKSSHEALIVRQDSELRALENLKRWLVSKIKCDRDYATALSSLTPLSLKIDKSEELTGSLLLQAIHAAVDTTEAITILLKQNAEYLCNVTLEKLNTVINDKRNSRKLYQEEYNRLAMELAVLQESVNRSKVEYEKSLESFKTAKCKYDEQCGNKGKGFGKKQEEAVRDKFQRAVKRLHVAHNEYVLALLEAGDYERDLRTVLIPGLLEHQQAVQEDTLLHCRLILKEIIQYTDLSSDSYRKHFCEFHSKVEDITAQGEYKDFIEKYRSLPPAPQPPIFDARLSAIQENNHSYPLRPDRVTVDDLTLENLKQRIKILEQKLGTVQNDLSSKQNVFYKHETELQGMKDQQASEIEMSMVRRHCEGLRRQINELKCVEQKWQRQVDIIAEAFSALSGKIPAGCELHLNETLFTTVYLDEEPPSSNPCNSSLGKRKGQSLVDIFKRPFSRKAPTPPASPNAAFKVAKDEYLKTEEAATKQEELLACSIEEGSQQTGENGGMQESFPPPLPPALVQPTIPAVAAGLSEKEWFHGVLPREEVVRLLVNEGDFLVRETTRHEERQVVLSVCWAGHKHFIVQTTQEGFYRFEGPVFPTVQELIAHQLDSGLPVTTKSGAVLKKAIPRETWELNNDDVELVEKIGSGNFGDVYQARLRPSGMTVAVKTCRHTLPDEQKKKFLQEGRILKQYEHPNVVRLIGICVQKQPIMIVMELVPGGSLLNFLRQKSNYLTVLQLICMCSDVAAGMAYLESRNCIHRDLAVRNCLVGENNVVKISDFGMSREEQEYIVSDGMKQIPIKWTAPEALNYGKYTSLCDVWSFGVLCWEVFSRGGIPYSGLSNTKARQMIGAGYRMPAPEGTPDEMYRLMRRCWEYEPERRPHFEEICHVLDSIKKQFS